jgi:vacuolar-type H+-ATPase subunit D/Vma8
MKPFTEEQRRDAHLIDEAYKLKKKEAGIMHAIFTLQNEAEKIRREINLELNDCNDMFFANSTLKKMSDDDEHNNMVLHEYMEKAGVR